MLCGTAQVPERDAVDATYGRRLEVYGLKWQRAQAVQALVRRIGPPGGSRDGTGATWKIRPCVCTFDTSCSWIAFGFAP